MKIPNIASVPVNLINNSYPLIESCFGGEDNNKLTILSYHSVADGRTRVDIPLPLFKKQVAYLIDRGFNFVSLDEVVDYIEGKTTINSPTVAITFDDGYENITHKALPLLGRHNIPATLFVIADPKHANRSELANGNPLLSLNQVSELQSSGWAIGCHTMTHPSFLNNASLDFDLELHQAKSRLEAVTESEIKYFAYPKGVYNEKILRAVKKARFRAAFDINLKTVGVKTNLYTIPRIAVLRKHNLIKFRAFFTGWGLTLAKKRRP